MAYKGGGRGVTGSPGPPSGTPLWLRRCEHQSVTRKQTSTEEHEEFGFNSYTRTVGLNDSNGGHEYRPNMQMQ